MKERTSLADILSAGPVEVAELLMKKGVLQKDPPERGSCKCTARQTPRWKLEAQGHSCQWRCKACRKTLAVTRRDEDLFGKQRLALRSLAGAMWLYTSGLHFSPDQASVVLGVDHRTLRALYETFNKLFTPLVEQLNSELVVGACGADLELDEVAFRSVGRPGGIVWLRYIGVARRGSSKVWLQRLPYRVTQAGQGGGGPLSLEEMKEALLLESDKPVLAEGSVCHTDGAKAYRALASPTTEGPLVDGSLTKFGLKLAHTAVKHKPPHPEFTKRFEVNVWTGESFEKQVRLGGTQKLDGFFASFRRVVGRKPFNNVGASDESAPRMEELMHFHVRAFQLKMWFAGCDMFAVYGKLRELARAGVDNVKWCNLTRRSSKLLSNRSLYSAM